MSSHGRRRGPREDCNSGTQTGGEFAETARAFAPLVALEKDLANVKVYGQPTN